MGNEGIDFCFARLVGKKKVYIPHDLQKQEDLDDELGRCVYCNKVFERAGASNEPGQQ